jgi:hypothetical protein
MDSDDSANNGVRVINDLDTLLNWMEIDPVDTWEMSRNDITQSIQGNRNVFIDYPEMAWLLFAKSLPGNYDTPLRLCKGTWRSLRRRTYLGCMGTDRRTDLHRDRNGDPYLLCLQ